MCFVLIYLKEITPDAVTNKTGFDNMIPLYRKKKGLTESSGKMCVIHYLFIHLGMLTCEAIGALLDEVLDTKSLLLVSVSVPLIPLILRIIGFLFIFKLDTPKYYAV